MWDISGRNIKLDQAELINMGSLRKNSVLNVAAWGIRKGSNSFFSWLAETWTKRWPMVSKVEMPDMP